MQYHLARVVKMQNSQNATQALATRSSAGRGQGRSRALGRVPVRVSASFRLSLPPKGQRPVTGWGEWLGGGLCSPAFQFTGASSRQMGRCAEGVYGVATEGGWCITPAAVKKAIRAAMTSPVRCE